MTKEELSQALITAVIKNDIKKVQSLINQGADVNYQFEEFGSAPLHYVTSAKMAQILIDNGADVNCKDIMGLTPLHLVRSPQIAQILINNGADVDAEADDDRTPLFFARNAEIAQTLINNGADVDAEDDFDNTPMHQVRNIEIAQVLIKNRADINVKNDAGFRPLDMCQDDKIRALLIQNGAKPGKKNVSENQVANVNTDLLQTPTGPEYGHSAAPVSDREIRAFVNNDLKIEPDTHSSRNRMFKALKEVCRTPTGCMAFRATRANIKERNYHLDVTLSKDTDVDYYGCTVPDSHSSRIYIQTKNIQNSYPNNTGEADFKIGATFLHEALHVRQNQNPRLWYEPNSTITDAPTSALTRQIALESPYKNIRRREDISDTERLSYERAVRLKPNGSYDAVAAQRYSAHMQQIYTREFLREPGEQPLVNYASFPRQYAYLSCDMHAHLLLDWERSPSDEAYADLEQRFNMSVDNENFVKNQVTNALKPYAKNVKKHCSFEQRKALYYALENGDTSLSPVLFPKESMARKAAEAYLTTSNDINDKLLALSNLSTKIHDRPHSPTELIEAAIRRKELKEKYGIDIETHNLSGERVADSIDISTDRTSSTLEGILRQAEQNGAPADESQSHGAYNPTLANNSRTNITTHDADFSNQTPHPSSRNNGGNENIA